MMGIPNLRFRMNLEKTIMDLTSKTPSGGTCWIGKTSFKVNYGSDFWEWEFQDTFYFDPLDLSEAINGFQQASVEGMGLRAVGPVGGDGPKLFAPLMSAGI